MAIFHVSVKEVRDIERFGPVVPGVFGRGCGREKTTWTCETPVD